MIRIRVHACVVASVVLAATLFASGRAWSQSDSEAVSAANGLFSQKCAGCHGSGAAGTDRAPSLLNNRHLRAAQEADIAELLRVRGELLLTQGAPGAAAKAEEQFGQALDWALRQGALSWELRAATSLARLRRDQHRPADGIALLRPIYDRFTEGFGTADLRNARALLGDLR